MFTVRLKEAKSSIVQCDCIGLLANLDSSQLVQFYLPNVAAPHAPLGISRQTELLHGHYSVHNVVQWHYTGKFGDKDQVCIQISGKFTDILLKAVLGIADEVSGIIQDRIPAIDDNHGIVHLLCFIKEYFKKIQNCIIVG
jgi:hypothetical protein